MAITHGLRHEGAPFNVPDCAETACVSVLYAVRDAAPLLACGAVVGTGGAGHGVCACGAISGHLPSGAARRRWHNDHKETAAMDGTSTPDVRPGQVWADYDSRCAGRTLRVDEVEDPRARCTVLTDGGDVTVTQAGKQTRISVSRFKPTSTGYRLIRDSP